MGDDSQALVERARKGDRAAFGLLVRRYHRRVYGLAHRMLGNHDDADDVAQETFVRAYSRLGQFQGQADFFTWLYRIALNVALNQLRHARRHREAGRLGLLPAPLAQEADADPQRAAELRRAMAELAVAFESLSDTLKATVVLVLMEGMAYREAAAVLECSEGTVAWRVHEARSALRRQLGPVLKRLISRDTDGLSGDTREAVDLRR
ncbi:MAG: sigma-70 family RNA polymerase sigma factor [Deltaproteobacteria bacterium]|nr:sigma-70 family RNA polymerase sigma factor [Deltaproteobacteria bacterium]